MDAAEQRRQKILRNSNRRMELLLGMKQDSGLGTDQQQQQQPVVKQPLLVQTSTNKDTSSTLNGNEMLSTSYEPKASTSSVPVQRKKGSILFSKPNETADLSTGQIRINGSDTAALNSGQCRFNGYSNNEILIMFLLALFTCMLFFFEQSYYIGQVGCVP